MLILLPYHKNSGKQKRLYLSEREVVGLWSSQQMHLFCFWVCFLFVCLFCSRQGSSEMAAEWILYPVGVAVTFNIKKKKKSGSIGLDVVFLESHIQYLPVL